MTITTPDVDRYMKTLAPTEHPILQEMERVAEEKNFPIIGPLCGRILHQYALAIDARRIFEMGSGYGYSTFWFALATGPEGRIVHTDGDAGNSAKAKDYLGRAGLADRVTFEVGNAMEILRRYDGPYDIILIDVDKDGYPEALECAKPKLRPGGLIITDNVLWSGRVAEPNPDATTQAILRYTKMAYEDPGFWTTILPVRDGLAVSLKK
jgi:caffeoyl-CoA O-methyltransferase